MEEKLKRPVETGWQGGGDGLSPSAPVLLIRELEEGGGEHVPVTFR